MFDGLDRTLAIVDEDVFEALKSTGAINVEMNIGLKGDDAATGGQIGRGRVESECARGEVCATAHLDGTLIAFQGCLC